MNKPLRAMKVKVFVEGGSLGEGKNPTVNIEFRKAFAILSTALEIARHPQFVPCGGRDATFDAAWNEFINRADDEIILLLVDGEDGSSEKPEDCWRHLKAREGQNWRALEEKHAPYVFMMATCMETWLVADIEALREFFGSCLNENPIKAWPKLEVVHRKTMFDALQRATASCGVRRYDKGDISFRSLQHISPQTVAKSCPHARRFFTSLPILCRRVML